MREKLISKIEHQTGMRFGLAGLFVTMLGTGLAFTLFPMAGYWIGLAGALLGLLGMGIHFVINWLEIFNVDRS